jgi:hypothetical protein
MDKLVVSRRTACRKRSAKPSGLVADSSGLLHVMRDDHHGVLLAVDLQLLQGVPGGLHEFGKGVGDRGVVEA